MNPESVPVPRPIVQLCVSGLRVSMRIQIKPAPTATGPANAYATTTTSKKKLPSAVGSAPDGSSIQASYSGSP